MTSTFARLDLAPFKRNDLLADWIDDVEARCGAVRNCLATGLAEAADDDLTVRVDHHAFMNGLRRRCAILSYGGFRKALRMIANAGVLEPTDDPDRYRLAVREQD